MAETLKEYQEGALSTAIYPGKDKPGLDGITYTVLGLVGETGEVCEKVKKSLRGDHTLFSVREDILRELGDVLWYLSMTAYEMDSSLEEIANMNLKKLADRAERQKLRGSGDNR